MEKKEILEKINKDFETFNYFDVWNNFENYIDKIKEYIQPEFKKYSSGLMVDFTESIEEIITTTFITNNIFDYIVEKNKKNVLIFAHHPYYQKQIDNSWHDSISKNIEVLKNNKIAIYVCHMALDFHSELSTAYYFAKELIKDFQGRLSYKYKDNEVECEYYGEAIENLMERIESLSKKTMFYQFNDTKPKKICCSPGGGNIIDIIKLAKEKNVDTYITGVSEFKGVNSISRNKAYFEELEKIGINIIGLGHYETECIAMKRLVKDYFSKYNIKTEYFKDKFYE